MSAANKREQGPRGPKGPGLARRQGVAEVVDLVKAYVRQELLGPLRGAGRWVSVGLAGSVALVVGVILLLLSLLRALQTETGTAFAGNLSWIPYLIAVAGLVAVIAALLRQVGKRGLR